MFHGMHDGLANRCVDRKPHIEPVDSQQHGCVVERRCGFGPADERACVQQFARVGVLRLIVDVEDWCLLDDFTVAQHGYVIGHLPDHAQVVADPHHRGAEIALQVAHQLDDLRLCRHVQRRGRLVGDQEFGIARECDRDHHPLALPARQLVRIRV